MRPKSRSWHILTFTKDATHSSDVIAYIDRRLDYLKESRPTAVDLTNAINKLKAVIRNPAEPATDQAPSLQTVIGAYIHAAELILSDDLQTNHAIGSKGADWILAQPRPSSTKPLSVLTHCNTGSLATSGHGTALGIIRSLHAAGQLHHAFCTETRPYNQGSRLTAFELVFEQIPATLIADSMAAALFRLRRDSENIAAVVVGADRVVRNGDTANKIGTYQLAVLARHHGVKFVVAAPTTSVDLATATGEGIRIEERPGRELTQISGAVMRGEERTGETARVAIADQRVGVWNPAFDVTPAALIDAIVTEKGVVEKDADGRFNFVRVLPERAASVVPELEAVPFHAQNLRPSN